MDNDIIGSIGRALGLIRQQPQQQQSFSQEKIVPRSQASQNAIRYAGNFSDNKPAIPQSFLPDILSSATKAQEVLGAQATPKASVRPLSPESQRFASMAQPIAEQYGIPMAVLMGQFAAEGRWKGLGANRNNFFNINAVDENPNQASQYETPQAGIEAYAKLLADPTFRYAPAMQLRNDPVAMLKAIEQAGYAGDPTTYDRRSPNGYASYSDFVMNTPEWKYYMSF